MICMRELLVGGLREGWERVLERVRALHGVWWSGE